MKKRSTINLNWQFVIIAALIVVVTTVFAIANNYPNINDRIIAVRSGKCVSMFLTEKGKVYLLSSSDVESHFGADYTSPLREICFPSPIVDIGVSSTCAYALSTNGELWMWGSNINGQLCEADLEYKTTEPKRMLLNWKIKRVSICDYTCFVETEDGILYVWGNNSLGAIGVTDSITTNIITTPTVAELYLDSNETIEKITSGNVSISVLSNNNDLYRAGLVVPFQQNNEFYSATYTRLMKEPTYSFPAQIIKHCTGTFFDLYILADGSVFVNGYNTEGELCTHGTEYLAQPQKLEVAFKIKDAVVYENGALLLTQENDIYYMGYIGDQLNNRVRALVTSQKWKSLSISSTHATLLDTDGQPWIVQFPSGVNNEPMMYKLSKDKLVLDIYVAEKTPNFAKEDVSKIVCGCNTIIAVMKDGKLFSWGLDNSTWAAGTGKPVVACEPTYVPLKAIIEDVYIGQGYCIAMSADGIIYTWGVYSGGNGTTKELMVPKELSLPERVVKMFPGTSTCIVQGESGLLYQWGNPSAIVSLNKDGKGLLTPVAIENIWNFTDFSLNHTQALGLDKKGNVWHWGEDYTTEAIRQNSVPMMINMPEEIVSICAGTTYCYAIGKSGTLYGWGRNNWNNLLKGDNAIIIEQPTALLVEYDFKEIKSPYLSTLAVTQENYVLNWGLKIGGEDLEVCELPECISRNKDIDEFSCSADLGVVDYEDGSFQIMNNKYYNPFERKEEE